MDCKSKEMKRFIPIKSGISDESSSRKNGLVKKKVKILVLLMKFNLLLKKFVKIDNCFLMSIGLMIPHDCKECARKHTMAMVFTIVIEKLS
jgi:hypothetical protein